ncbi:alcohol dehydrogenase catalytic domain-containing protein [Candidatus Aerophobetes bacterium]|nr:alcohol dehydrogenase catalytic domain-containing protein [Candidatus Aerophobetes bacterium]
MKAAILNNIKDIRVRGDVPLPEISENEILIQVKTCTICATDIKLFYHGHKNIRFPRIIGHEVAGKIIKTGNKVKGFSIGERVAIAPAIPCGTCYYCARGIQSMCLNLRAIGFHYDGGFAEYMAVPENAVRNGCVNIIPENVSFEEASLAEPLACVINGQELSRISCGDTVVVIGAGPVGCMHIQLARVKGAAKIILVEVDRSRISLAEKITSPDLIINPKLEDAIERIKRETEGRGADKIIVACSSGEAQEKSLEMVAPRGVVNFFDGLPKDKPFIKFNSNLVHYREFYVVGTHGSAPRHNELALKLISTGKIKIKELITHQFLLDDFEKALSAAQDPRAMKVVVYPS